MLFFLHDFATSSEIMSLRFWRKSCTYLLGILGEKKIRRGEKIHIDASNFYQLFVNSTASSGEWYHNYAPL